MTTYTGNLLRFAVADIATVITDWTSVHIYKASSRLGSYSLLTTVTLVAEQTWYTYQDTVGLDTDWYKYALFNTGTAAEDVLSNPEPGNRAPAILFSELAQRTADRLGCYVLPEGDFTFPGSSGTTTGAGNGGGTTVVCSQFADSEYASNAFKGAYLRLTSGTYSGQERRITSFDKTTGTFTVARAFGGQVASSVTFEAYLEVPGDRFRWAVNRACRDVWTPFSYTIAGIDGQTLYALPSFIEDKAQIRNFYRRLTNNADINLNKDRYLGGYDFIAKAREGGGVDLYLPNALPENALFEVEGIRHIDMFTGDTDSLILSEQNQDELVCAAAMRVADWIVKNDSNLDRKATWKDRRDELERERQSMVRKRRINAEHRSARQTSFVGWGNGLVGY